MAVDTYTPLFSEVLNRVAKLKTKNEKIEHLRKYNNDSLRMIIKSSFDPKIEWELPEGDVPYTKNDAPEGTEHNVLAHESRKLYHFIMVVIHRLLRTREKQCLSRCLRVFMKMKQNCSLLQRTRSCIRSTRDYLQT